MENPKMENSNNNNQTTFPKITYVLPELKGLEFLSKFRTPSGRLKYGTLKMLTPEQKLAYTSAYSTHHYRNTRRKSDKPLRKYVKLKQLELPCPTCEVVDCPFVPAQEQTPLPTTN